MKKMVSLFLAFAMSVPLCIPAFAVGDNAQSNSTTMTIDQFESRYVGANPSTDSVASVASATDVSVASIEYGNIVYNPTSREISFDATVSEAGELTNFGAEGTLYSSYKADLGINSIVGALQDTTGQYEILRFEIYNDNDLSRLYAINTPATASIPTLVMYLREGEKLYLFETAIPSEMAAIVVPNTPECKTTEGSVDGFWFQEIVDPIVTIDGLNIQSGTNSGSMVLPLAEDGGNVYKTVNATWTVMGINYKYYAQTKVTYYFVDVDTGDNTWDLRFGINNAYAYVDGVRSDLTGLRITNVDMSMASGPYTRMMRAFTTFDLHDSYTVGDPSTLTGLVSVVAGSTGVNAASVAADILSLVLDKSLSTRALTNNCTTLLDVNGSDVYGRAFRYYVPDRYFLQHTDNYVSFQIVTRASRFLQSSGTNDQRTGIVEVGFDYYAGDGTTKYHHDFDRITGSYYCDLS